MPYPTEALYADVAQIQHAEFDLFGSGRLIAHNLVLTASHVLTREGDASPEKQGWQVRLLAGRPRDLEAEKWTWIDASVVWLGQKKLDLALLELQPRGGAGWYPKLSLRIARVDQVQHHSV